MPELSLETQENLLTAAFILSCSCILVMIGVAVYLLVDIIRNRYRA